MTTETHWRNVCDRPICADYYDTEEHILHAVKHARLAGERPTVVGIGRHELDDLTCPKCRGILIDRGLATFQTWHRTDEESDE